MKYSFVVPIYNDGYLAEAFCAEFQEVFREYLGQNDIGGEVELIFVNDGSSDDSSDRLERSVVGFPFARIINLSRNFGQHVALSCGYRHARGEFVGMLNADMQEHPNQIPLLLNAIRSGDADIVLGLRRQRCGGKWDAFTSRLFALCLNKLTGYDTPINAATLRVMNRQFVDAYNSLSESSRYQPGLEDWLGFRKNYVEIEHRARLQGKSSYTFFKRLKIASEAIISFSDLPLRITVLTGFGVVAVSFILSLGLAAQRLFFADMQLGYTSTICVIVFLSGVQLLVVGLASLYIGRILREVQRRPLYVIKSTVNLTPESRHD